MIHLLVLVLVATSQVPHELGGFRLGMSISSARAAMRASKPPLEEVGPATAGKHTIRATTTAKPSIAVSLVFPDASESGQLVSIKRQATYDDTNAPTVENVKKALSEKYGKAGLEKTDAISSLFSWVFTPSGSLAEDQSFCLMQAHMGGSMQVKEAKGRCGIFVSAIFREKNGLVSTLSTEMVDVEGWRSALEKEATSAQDKANQTKQQRLQEAKDRKPDI